MPPATAGGRPVWLQRSSSISQGKARRVFVEQQDDVALVRRAFLQAVRHQHLEQRLGDVGIADRAAAGLGDEGVGQAQLTGRQRDLGPRLVGGGDEAQPVAVRIEDDFQALPPRQVRAEAQALAPALALLDAAPLPAQRRPEDRAVEHRGELARGAQRDVLVDLEDLEPVDQYPLVEFRGLELAIGGERAAQHRLDRVAHPQCPGPGAHQQAAGPGPPRAALRLRILRRPQVRAVDHLQRVLQQRIAHAVLELSGRKLADLAEADDECPDRLGVGALVEEDRVAAACAGVEPEVAAPRQRPAQALVERELGADDGVAEVMADEHGVARIRQVAVAQADLDDRGQRRGGGSGTARRRGAAEAEHGHGARRPEGRR